LDAGDSGDLGANGNGGDWPTDSKNNGYSLPDDGAKQRLGFGIPSWYMLSCRNLSATNKQGGSRQTPFVYFNGNDPSKLVDPLWQRSISRVKKSSELLMIVEATSPNWFDQTDSGVNDPAHPGNFLRRLAARHGRRTGDGANAWTNFAFFDGHVGYFETKRFEAPKDMMDNQRSDVIFYLNKQ
jgi:prepilin-type processing-associated H-X9-DG protein